MNLAEWAIMLSIVGVVMFVAEFFLPTHGVLGVLGGVVLLAAVGVCFAINQYLGVTMLLGGTLLAPVVGAAMVRLWPRTWVGRKILLPEVDSRPEPLRFHIGEVGVAVSELRPMGICEFDGGRRLEAVSEHGIVAAGSRVKVMGTESRRPVVRVV
jgi:membrane-bound ClpP family serine protease